MAPYSLPITLPGHVGTLVPLRGYGRWLMSTRVAERQLNAAIYRTAIVRIRFHEPTIEME